MDMTFFFCALWSIGFVLLSRIESSRKIAFFIPRPTKWAKIYLHLTIEAKTPFITPIDSFFTTH